MSYHIIFQAVMCFYLSLIRSSFRQQHLSIYHVSAHIRVACNINDLLVLWLFTMCVCDSWFSLLLFTGSSWIVPSWLLILPPIPPSLYNGLIFVQSAVTPASSFYLILWPVVSCIRQQATALELSRLLLQYISGFGKISGSHSKQYEHISLLKCFIETDQSLWLESR